MLNVNIEQFRVAPPPPPAPAEGWLAHAEPCRVDHPEAVARRRGPHYEVRVGQAGPLTGQPYEPARVIVERTVLFEEQDRRPRRRHVPLVGFVGGGRVQGRVPVPAADHQLGVGAAGARLDPFHQHWRVDRLEAQVRLGGARSGSAELIAVRRVEAGAVAGQVDGPDAEPVPVAEPQQRQRSWVGGEFCRHLERGGGDAGGGIGVGRQPRIRAAVQRLAGPRRGQAPPVPARYPFVHEQVGTGLRGALGGGDRVFRAGRVIGGLHDRQLGKALLVGDGEGDRARVAEPVGAVPAVERAPLAGPGRPDVEPVAAEQVPGVERAGRGAAHERRLERLVVLDRLQQLGRPPACEQGDPARAQ